VSKVILPIEACPEDIQRRIEAGESLVLIDVREPEEFAITRIEGATLIPMRDIQQACSNWKPRPMKPH